MEKTEKNDILFIPDKIKKPKSIKNISRYKKRKDINKLYSKFSHIKFFKKLEQKNLKNKIFELLSKIKIENHKKSSILFKEGDLPLKFYIIISGEILVLIKNKKKQKNQKNQKTDEKLNQILLPYKNKKNINNFFYNKKDNILKHKIVAILKKGSSFGELGIIHDEKRLATIITDTDCKFGVITYEDFKNIINLHVLEKIDEKFKYFKNFLGSVLEKKEFLRVSAFFQEKVLENGFFVFKENDIFEKVFILIKGCIVVTKNLSSLEFETKCKKDSKLNFYEENGEEEDKLFFCDKKNFEVGNFKKNNQVKNLAVDVF